MVTSRRRLFLLTFLSLLLPVAHLLVSALPAAAVAEPGSRTLGVYSQAGGEAAPPPIAVQLQQLAEDNYGSCGIYLNVLETGEQAGYAENETFYAASCYKLFLVMFIYEQAARGEVDLSRTIAMQGGDLEGEEGVIQSAPVGTAFTTRDLCRYAIVNSDNVAARMLKRTYGYRTFRDYAASIGCPVAGTYNINSTTAREMGILLMRVLQFAATDPLGQEVVAFLKESTTKGRIPAGLPAGVEVGNKTGDYQGTLNDAAIVFLDDLTYVLCVLSKGGSDSVHREASRLVYEDIYRRHYGGGASATRVYQPATQWYFAHANTAEGLETWLCMTNGGTGEAAATVRNLAGQAASTERVVNVPPGSTVSLRLNQLFGAGQDLALSVLSSGPLLYERATYQDGRRGWTLVGTTAGLNQPAAEWFFSSGVNGQVLDTRLYLCNPGTADAGCTVCVMTGGARSQRLPVAVPAQGHLSLPVSDLVGGSGEVALCVLASAPVLAEEAAYPRQQDGAAVVEGEQ
ncbi:MAG: DUF5719 family protein [Actinomycetota bacterium]